jgi:hypothetical protein
VDGLTRGNSTTQRLRPFTITLNANSPILKGYVNKLTAHTILRAHVVKLIMNNLEKIEPILKNNRNIKMNHQITYSELKSTMVVGDLKIDQSNDRISDHSDASKSNSKAKDDNIFRSGYLSLSNSRALSRLGSESDIIKDSAKSIVNTLVFFGVASSGKSTAAEVFKQSALKRSLAVIHIIATVTDFSTPYSIVRKILDEMLLHQSFKVVINPKKVELGTNRSLSGLSNSRIAHGKTTEKFDEEKSVSLPRVKKLINLSKAAIRDLVSSIYTEEDERMNAMQCLEGVLELDNDEQPHAQKDELDMPIIALRRPSGTIGTYTQSTGLTPLVNSSIVSTHKLSTTRSNRISNQTIG